jgi:glucose/arabinose dehydrogenase
MSLLESLKEKTALITTSITLVGAIGGGVLYFESTYAHAEDVKEVVKSNQAVIQSINAQQRQSALFQMEYYDDRLSRLRNELAISEAAGKNRQGLRSPTDIERDITDTTQRKEITKRSLIDGK